MSKGRPAIIWLSLSCGAALGLQPALSAAPGEAHGAFAETLRAAGWQIDILMDGSLELRPGGDARADASGANPAPSTARNDQRTGGWGALRGHGWRVVNDSDGATLLFPPGTTNSTEAQLSTSAPPPAPEELARDLDALLAERGWRVERAADGSLQWFPLPRTSSAKPMTPPGDKPSPEVADAPPPSGSSSSETPPTAQTSAPATQTTEERAVMTCGFLPAEVRIGRIPLPIDDFFKARMAVRSWLYATKDPRLRFGRIQWFGRGFLVDIVEATRPHLVRYQLIVSAQTGRVVVL